jgi:hypothetical protein
VEEICKGIKQFFKRSDNGFEQTFWPFDAEFYPDYIHFIFCHIITLVKLLLIESVRMFSALFPLTLMLILRSDCQYAISIHDFCQVFFAFLVKSNPLNRNMN